MSRISKIHYSSITVVARQFPLNLLCEELPIRVFILVIQISTTTTTYETKENICNIKNKTKPLNYLKTSLYPEADSITDNNFSKSVSSSTIHCLGLMPSVLLFCRLFHCRFNRQFSQLVKVSVARNLWCPAEQIYTTTTNKFTMKYFNYTEYVDT